MTVWEEFLAAIKDETELLQELIRLGRLKQEAINDAQGVARLAEEEQKVVVRLEEVDRLRASLFPVLAGGKGLEDWLESLPEEKKEEAAPLILELTENLAELQALNRLNQELLAQSLSFVRFSLNLLTGEEAAPTYSRQGGSIPGRSILDRKV